MKKHKFIKKLIAAVGILAVGAVTLTACSNNSSRIPQAITLARLLQLRNVAL